MSKFTIFLDPSHLSYDMRHWIEEQDPLSENYDERKASSTLSITRYTTESTSLYWYYRLIFKDTHYTVVPIKDQSLARDILLNHCKWATWTTLKFLQEGGQVFAFGFPYGEVLYYIRSLDLDDSTIFWM